LINVALPENSPAGLFLLERDPRKQRKKPDAYTGIVEEVAPGCVFVSPGDKIFFQRWEYTQENIDDERLIASEDELIVLQGERPAPGIIIIKLEDELPETELALPDTLRPKSRPSYNGQVICHSNHGMGELEGLAAPGKWLIFQKSDSYQWRYGNGLVAIRVCKYFDVLAVYERVVDFQAV
jgi:hypothetical protein